MNGELSVLLGGVLVRLDADRVRRRLVEGYGLVPENAELVVNGGILVLR